MAETRKTESKPGSVRIIGGTWRRRRIVVPSGLDLRPTPDRVRETLFNWLEPSLAGARCLDLYAGTGVLGFEALSRGAGRALLVERDARVAAALERQALELGANAEIACASAEAFLERVAVGPFDVAFVDPPYSTDVVDVLESLQPVLAPDARVYLERERGAAWPTPPGLEWTRRATAGSVEFALGELVDRPRS